MQLQPALKEVQRRSFPVRLFDYLLVCIAMNLCMPACATCIAYKHEHARLATSMSTWCWVLTFCSSLIISRMSGRMSESDMSPAAEYWPSVPPWSSLGCRDGCRTYRQLQWLHPGCQAAAQGETRAFFPDAQGWKFNILWNLLLKPIEG